MMNKWQYSNSQSLNIPNTGIYLWIQALVIFGMAFYIRSRFMDWPLRFDEYYHILAARSWAIDGSFSILDGEYRRVPLFTTLVGWLFSIFGESIEIARLPSLLAGSLNVLLIFLFVNRQVGIIAAWISSLLFIFDPGSIDLSTQVRFYTIQGVLFWLAAILLFYGSHQSVSLHLRLGMVLIIVPALILAKHLQPITLIGIAGLVVWIIFEHGAKLAGIIRRFSLTHTALTVFIGVSVCAFIFLLRDDIGNILERYKSAPYWLQEAKDRPLYYHSLLMSQYPLLWSFFPIAALLALRSYKRIVGYCFVMFITLLLLHSFAGSKLLRYFNYAFPFLFIIWGIFLAGMFQASRNSLLDTISGRLGGYRQTIANLSVIILFSYSILSINFHTYHQTKRSMHQSEMDIGGWASAESLLKQLADHVDIVMVTDNNRAIYYIGRYDYAITPSLIRGTDTGREFGKDLRNGGHIIAKPQSISRILDCTDSGLFVSGQKRWNAIGEEGIDILLERTREIQTPGELGLIVRSWRSPNRNHVPECEDLPRR